MPGTDRKLLDIRARMLFTINLAMSCMWDPLDPPTRQTGLDACKNAPNLETAGNHPMHDMETSSFLEHAFHPRSIAIIGASADRNKLGYELVRGFVEMGFRGRIHPVNPYGSGEILGLPVHESIRAVPGEISLAIIITPPSSVPGLLCECAQRSVKGAILFSTPPPGAMRPEQRHALHAAKSAGMRVIGPNSMGLYCPVTGMTIFPDLPKTGGSVGVITHSGAMAWSIIFGLAERGLGCSKAVTVGNEWDLKWADFLEYLASDDNTQIITGYIEGVQDGRRFLEVARAAALKKPVFCMKGGTSAAGALSTQSHTGALAGSRLIWDGVFRQAGIQGTVDTEDTIDHAVLFQHAAAARIGRRIGVVSGTGGQAITTVDLCEAHGLSVPELSRATRRRLDALLPPYGTSSRNPVDVSILAATDLGLYTRPIDVLEQGDDVDVILCVHPGDRRGDELAQRIIEEKGRGSKLLIIILLGFTERNHRGVQLLLKAGIPAFRSQGSAVRALAALIRWKEGATHDGHRA